MIDVFFLQGYPVAVMGLGTSGLATAHALMQSGAEVLGWDDDPERRAAGAAKTVPLTDLTTIDWSEVTTLVLSPGIPHTHPDPHPVAGAARRGGAEIISDIELLGRTMRDVGYIGITGTNGKSTTTAMLGHILETAGYEIDVGGNFGTPALALRRLETGGIYVLEMSSYQLELTLSITFDVAVLLNISADHLDRHGGIDGYIEAKKRVFRRQTDPRSAIVGVDDDYCRQIFDALRQAGEQRLVPISCQEAVAGGVYALDGVLYDDIDGQNVPALKIGNLRALPGRHNWQNAAAAYAAARAVDVAPAVATTALQTFPGLAHRQELVAVIDGVAYVNDSKATNAEAAARALACYERIYWIAGGRAKEGGYEPVAPFLDRVAHAFLIGEAEESLAAFLAGRVETSRCGTLDTAFAEATAMARGSDGVVLLAPACASFDQFTDFGARGDAFCALVDDLPGKRKPLDDEVPGGAAA